MLLATLLMLVTVLAANFSMRLLLTAATLAGGLHSYEDLAKQSFGRSGRALLDACIVAMNMGAIVAYLNLSTDVLSYAAGTIIPPGAEPSRHFVLGIVTLCGAFPVSLFVRSPPVLSAISQASVGMLFVFAASLVDMALGPGASGLRSLVLWRPEGLLVSFPVVAYGFTAHQVLFSVVNSLSHPSLATASSVVSNSMALSALVYLTVGVAGYSSFGQRTQGDVLRNIGGFGAGSVVVKAGGDENGILMTRLALQRFVKVGYGLSLIATIPLLLLPLLNTFAPWAAACIPAGKAGRTLGGTQAQQKQQQRDRIRLRDTITISAVLSTACTIAILLPNVEYVFGLAGSTASVLISFILPAAIFLKASGGFWCSPSLEVVSPPPGLLRGHDTNSKAQNPRQLHVQRRLAGALLVFGAVTAIVCTGAMLSSIQQEKEVVQLVNELVNEDKKASAAVKAQTEAAHAAQTAGAASEAQQLVGDHATRLVGGSEGSARAAATAESLLSETKTRAGKKARAKAVKIVRSDLRPTIAAADALIESLERATASLSAALVRKGENSVAAGGASGSLAAAKEAAGESLVTARRSKLALLEMQRVVVSSLKNKESKVDDLEAKMTDVVDAAKAAEQNINRMIESLEAVRAEQSSKLGELIAELEASRVTTEVVERPGSVERTENEIDEKIDEEDSLHQVEKQDGGRRDDVASLSKEIEKLAADTVVEAKTSAEQAVESRSLDVAVRALEIAKELRSAEALPRTAAATDDEDTEHAQHGVSFDSMAHGEGKSRAGGEQTSEEIVLDENALGNAVTVESEFRGV